DRIVVCFIVSPKIPQQRIGECIAGSLAVSTGVKSKVPGVTRSPVLIFSITNDDHSHLDRVFPVNEGEVVAGRNVGGRRKQGPRRAVKAGEPVDGSVGNAIVKTAAREQLRISEIVGGTLPEFANRRYALTVVRDVYLGLIDQRWTDQPGIRDLVARAGPQTIGWNRRQLRSYEGPIGIDQVVMVVEVSSVDAMLFVKAI